MTEAEAKSNLETARNVLAEEWQSKNPQTPEEIAKFYKETTNYQADLDAWHADAGRQDWTNIIVATAKSIDAARILDVGAGYGHDLLAIRSINSIPHLAAIEPNDLMRQHLAEFCNEAVSSFEDLSNEKQFDLITCIDVLEHLPDPETQVLQGVVDRIRMGGVFIEATATHDIETPLHLASLRGWSPARFLDAHGFVVQREFENGRLRIWQRLYETREPGENLLLCAYRNVGVDTTLALFDLVKSGWRVSILSGDALISRVRSVAVSDWYTQDSNDVFLMIDDDIVFTEADALKVVNLAREKRGIASAAYPVRGATHLASRVKYKEVLTFGPDVEPIEIGWAGTGFVAVHRDVVEAIIQTMPPCINNGASWFWPMFMPFIYTNEENNLSEYLSEDWAFCERAQQLGFKVWLDPSVELTHIGQAPYTIRNMNNVIASDIGDD